MTKQVQLRRGTTAEHQVFTGAVGELTIDTTYDVAVVHDGVNPGGHYLVGSGFGSTVEQGIVNKAFIGIGTTTTNDYKLVVVGNSLLEGNIAARSLNIFYDPEVVRQGTLDELDPYVITGIATNNIRPGYLVTEPISDYIGVGATVLSVGIGSIEVSSPHNNVVGIITADIVFTDTLAGEVIAPFLDSVRAVIGEAGILTSYTQDAFINSGIITSAGISTASIDNVYINVGVLTTAGISSAYIDDLYVTTGIITGLTADTLLSTNAFISSGIITDLYTTNLSVSNLYSASGIITDLNVTNLHVDQAYISSGIVTDVNIETANVNDLNVNAGIATSFNSQTSSITNAYINVGVTTEVHIQDTAWINNARINSGVVTTIGVSSVAYVNDLYYSTGVGTVGNIDEVWIGDAYINSGVYHNI